MDFEDKPVAEIILCAGFLLIYLIEECVHNFLDSGVHHVQTETVQVHRSFSIHSQACEAGLVDMQKCASTPRPEDLEGPGTRRRRTISYPASLPNYKTFNSNPGLQTPISAAVPSTSRVIIRTTESSTSSSEESCPDSDGLSKSALRDFFTVLALSFHAVFEGLAVGLENEAKDVWLLFAGE